MWAPGGVIFGPPKPLDQFEPNFTGMILESHYWKLIKELESKQNSGCHGNQKKEKKNFLSETTGPTSI